MLIRFASSRDKPPKDVAPLHKIIHIDSNINWARNGVAIRSVTNPIIDVEMESENGRSIELQLTGEEARALGLRLLEQGDRVILTLKREKPDEGNADV